MLEFLTKTCSIKYSKNMKIQAVMHFAAFCYVGESVNDPGKYYRNNVAATIGLIESMVENDILKFIFSSTCATYGEPVEIPIKESHPQSTDQSLWQKQAHGGTNP